MSSGSPPRAPGCAAHCAGLSLLASCAPLLDTCSAWEGAIGCNIIHSWLAAFLGLWMTGPPPLTTRTLDEAFVP